MSCRFGSIVVLLLLACARGERPAGGHGAAELPVESVLAAAPAGTADFAGVVADSDLAVLGLRPDMTEAQVRALLGPPDSATPRVYNTLVEDSLSQWYYAGVSVSFAPRVDGVGCLRAACRTPRGVAIGDSVGLIDRLYGPASRFRSEQEGTVPDRRYTDRRRDWALDFFVRNGRVHEISLKYFWLSGDAPPN